MTTNKTAARRAKHLRQQQVPHRQVNSLLDGLTEGEKMIIETQTAARRAKKSSHALRSPLPPGLQNCIDNQRMISIQHQMLVGV